MNHQERADLLKKVEDLVGEHCNGFVFIADVESDEFREGSHESMMCCTWDGGVTICAGLLQRATWELRKTSDLSEDDL